MGDLEYASRANLSRQQHQRSARVRRVIESCGIRLGTPAEAGTNWILVYWRHG
jgi:hypothetical protein